MKNLTSGKEITFEEICALLKQGKCVVLPTDTTYGLIAWTGAKNALENLNIAKANPQAKPPQVLCSFDQALKYADFDERALKVAKTFWPGALTLVLNTSSFAKSFLPSQTIGLRVPNNDLLLKIMAKLGAGLFASSANIHGRGYIPDLKLITEFFAPQEIAIIEGISSGKSSSVVDMTKTEPVFLREGDITEEDLKKIL